jgi:colicin import membrane protein
MSDRNNTARQSGSHYQIPKEPGKNTALILAGVMHVLLFLFLWVGIHWQSKTPVGVDAEIWDVTTRDAAPVPVAVAPPPPPPAVETPTPPRPSAEEIQEEHDAEIALERAKEKQAAAEKQLKDQQEKQQKAQQEEQKRQDDLEKEQKEQKKQEAAKIAEQKKLDAKAEKQREDNLKRLTSQIAGSGGTGDAVKSTGNNRLDPSYAGKIAAKIRSHMAYFGSDNGPDNPTVEYTINLFPDGSLRGAPHKITSSGVPAFDDAVERAIANSAPYPADKSGNVPPTISPLIYRLKE